MLLDELIARHGEAAILTVRPYVLDSGETLRWVLEIDGKEPGMDVRIDEGEPWVVMFLVREDEEIELMRWTRKRYKYGPAAVIWTPGGLRRSERFGGP